MYFLIHSLQGYLLLGNNNVMDLNKNSGIALSKYLLIPTGVQLRIKLYN